MEPDKFPPTFQYPVYSLLLVHVLLLAKPYWGRVKKRVHVLRLAVRDERSLGAPCAGLLVQRARHVCPDRSVCRRRRRLEGGIEPKPVA